MRAGRPGIRLVRLLPRLQGQYDRVDAVPGVGGRGVPLTVEDVAQVGVTGGAPDLGADHAHGTVLVQDDRFALGGVEEAGPPAVGLELLVRAEQFGAASPATVDALALGVDVGAAPRALGRRPA